MRTPRRRTVVACSALLACFGCRTDIKPAEGDYVLARLDTGAVPGILVRQEPCLIVLAAGSMHIMKGDSFNSHFTIMRHCADSVTQVPDPGTHGPFTTNADTIYFGTADGRSGGAGIFHGDTIRVRGPQHSLTYIRKIAP